MIDRLAIASYRSIRSIVLRLDALNVVTGPNGSGKSSLYRALRLLADASDGQLMHSLAREGGFGSVLWAGPETISSEMISGQVPVQGTLRKKPVSLRLGISADPFSYSIELGLPPPTGSMFAGDPEIKRECLWRGPDMSTKSMCADRRGPALRCRGEKGPWREIELPLTSHSSMLSEYADPFHAPELILMREVLRSWRFYDNLRTDVNAPARRASVSAMTPILSDDGSDLAAALQTIREIGDATGLGEAINDAFPGSQLVIWRAGGGLQLALHQPGMLREMAAAELSDGTLRFLMLVAALLTPRPPDLMVLNEPENSLHPDLIPPLARLIQSAAEQSQVLVITHNQSLVDALETDALKSDVIRSTIRLEKRMGETIIQHANLLDQYGWKWPPR